ncbi:MAG TPA: hypothetical protein VK524_33350 [Polyangiaceae bacterium]|nr:hypothetical protein [Polyangiaceae bacterium]
MAKRKTVVTAVALLALTGVFGSIACGPVPPDGAGGAGGTGGGDYRPGFTPVATNPKECPPGAPANPIGPCVGLPIYVACNYTNGSVNYGCICDWVHWLCL